MATSGTVGQTEINVATLIEHAFRRAGKTPADQTPDALKAAKNNLYFYLCSLSNAGVNLWTIEKKIIGAKEGKQIYDLESSDLDIKTMMRRTIEYPSGGTAYSSAGGTANSAFDKDLTTACTQTSSNGYIYYAFEEGTTINTIGFMPNGDQTYTLVWEYSDDGVTWTEFYANDQAEYVDGEWYFWDLGESPKRTYYRMREIGGGMLNITELVFAPITLEIPITRMSLDQHSNLTMRTMQAPWSQQYWFDRQLTPRFQVWPVPDDSFDQYAVWKTRMIQDVGTLTNTLELPQRWIEPAVTALAIRLILELPDVDKERYQILKDEAKESTFNAQQEERDRSPIFVAPNIGCYTR